MNESTLVHYFRKNELGRWEADSTRVRHNILRIWGNPASNTSLFVVHLDKKKHGPGAALVHDARHFLRDVVHVEEPLQGLGRLWVTGGVYWVIKV